jgi:hypothetical protein
MPMQHACIHFDLYLHVTKYCLLVSYATARRQKGNATDAANVPLTARLRSSGSLIAISDVDPKQIYKASS